MRWASSALEWRRYGSTLVTIPLVPRVECFSMKSIRRRWKIEIYRDLLRAIHASRKNGRPVTLYRLETLARLPHTRVRRFVLQMQGAGFIDKELQITPHGYRFLGDMTSKIAPIMKRYGLWEESD